LANSLSNGELVRRGHTVTLFASGDSETLANLESVVLRSIGTDPDVDDPAVYDALQLHQVKDMADQFDLIHFHTWVPPFQLTEAIHTPTTLEPIPSRGRPSSSRAMVQKSRSGTQKS